MSDRRPPLAPLPLPPSSLAPALSVFLLSLHRLIRNVQRRLAGAPGDVLFADNLQGLIKELGRADELDEWGGRKAKGRHWGWEGTEKGSQMFSANQGWRRACWRTLLGHSDAVRVRVRLRARARVCVCTHDGAARSCTGL